MQVTIFFLKKDKEMSNYDMYRYFSFFLRTIKNTKAEQSITHPVSPLLIVYSASVLINVELVDISLVNKKKTKKKDVNYIL